MKKTPFYDVGLEYGAKMVEAFGYFLPSEYSTGHHNEHNSTRTKASLCDLDYMGEFTVSGPDSLAFIQKVSTNNFKNKTAGSIQYTAFCNEKGLMVDDCTIWCMGDNEYIIISGSEDDYNWLSKNIGEYDVTLKNITNEHTTLSLQGPNSRDILQSVVDFNVSDIKFYRFVRGSICGVDCMIGRLGFTGELGYELHFAPQHGEKIWKEIMSAGQSYGIAPCGQLALESLRQEAGFLLVGQDHDSTVNPFEAGIGFTVSLEKDDFVGKAALKNIVKDGVARQMTWIDIDGDANGVKIGDGVFVDNVSIGTITSSSFSPSRRRGTAMAYIKPSHAIAGVRVKIGSSGDHQSHGRLSLSPLYDPGKTRSRGL